MGELVEFNGATLLDLEPHKVLGGAQDANLKYVLIIGEDAAGELYFASSESDLTTALWLIEQIKLKILSGEFA